MYIMLLTIFFGLKNLFIPKTKVGAYTIVAVTASTIVMSFVFTQTFVTASVYVAIYLPLLVFFYWMFDGLSKSLSFIAKSS